MFEFRLPDIGEGLSEGELLEWVVKVGDRIAEGDPVAEISTDKVAVTLPAPRGGVVAELCWQLGSIVPVGAVLMRIDDGTGTVESSRMPAGAGHGRPSTPVAAMPAPGAPTPSAKPAGPLKAAPIVRRYAQERGVDLAAVAASNPGAELTREAIDAYLARAATSAPAAAGVRRERLSGPRLAAANRMAQSSRILATTTLSFDVFGDGIQTALAARAAEAEGRKVRLSPLAVIACCVTATLRSHARFNATIHEEANELVMYDAVALGIAVDTEAGLMVPVVREAQQLDVWAMAAAIGDRARQARAGSLAAADFQHSTFTISSTGGLERMTMTSTTPLINVPNVAILWVSRISERARVVDGRLEVGPVLSMSLSFDHRYIHGAEAIAMLNDLADRLRAPESCLAG